MLQFAHVENHLKNKTFTLAAKDEMNARLLKLQVKLAYQAACSNIELMCKSLNKECREPEGVEQIRTCWYDITHVTEGMEPFVSESVEYLEQRKLLKRHPINVHWVRPVHEFEMGNQ